MAVDRKGRRTSFDNIAVGSATGVERTISGGGGQSTTVYANGERIRSSVSGDPTTPGIEHFIAGTTGQTNA